MLGRNKLLDLTGKCQLIESRLYIDSLGTLNHADALALAARYGLEVPTKEQLESWSKQWKGCSKWLRSSSVVSDFRIGAWIFYGNDGDVHYGYRGNGDRYSVRCVGKVKL